MVKTIAHAIGYDATRVKRVHRLGHDHSEAEVATWRTFAKTCIWPDGAGHVSVIRDGKVIYTAEWKAET